MSLKSFKEKQFSKVENLREEIIRENQVLYNLHRETRGLKYDLGEREKEGKGPSEMEKVRDDCLVASSLRRGQSYQENPMPNFNFHSIPAQAEASYLKYHSRKPSPSPAYDPRLHLHPQPEYDRPASHYQQEQVQYWGTPAQAQYSYSTSCLAPSFSGCEACGKPANFLCSACKSVHYCTPRCQVRKYFG